MESEKLSAAGWVGAGTSFPATGQGVMVMRKSYNYLGCPPLGPRARRFAFITLSLKNMLLARK